MEDPTTWDSIVNWLESSGLRILLILAVIWVVRKFGNLAIRRAIRQAISSDKFASPKDEEQREDTLISITTATVRVLLWAVGGMLIIQELGINIGPLVAGASVFGAHREA